MLIAHCANSRVCQDLNRHGRECRKCQLYWRRNRQSHPQRVAVAAAPIKEAFEEVLHGEFGDVDFAEELARAKRSGDSEQPRPARQSGGGHHPSKSTGAGPS